MTEPVAPAPVRAVRRRRTRLYVLLAILILLVAYTGLDLYASRKLDAEIARLEPKYGNLRIWTLTELPAVPAGENRARLVRAAAALVVPPDKQSMSSVNFSGYINIGRDAPVPADVRSWVEANRRAIEFAAEIPKRARSNWELQYPSGDNVPFVDMRFLAQALYFSGVLQLEANHTDAAVQTAVVGLSVASSVKQERQLIAQLIRLSLADRPIQLVQRLLTNADPSKDSLESLARALAENRSPDPARTGLEGEMAYTSTMLRAVAEGRSTGMAQPPWVGLLGRLGKPFVRLVHVRYLQQMDRLISVQAGPRPRPKSPILPRTSRWSLFGWFLGNFTVGLERTMETSDDYTSHLSAAEIAVALRRYKLDLGGYPEDLAALAPRYIDQLPINPYTGKPAVYERTAKGFVVHAPAGKPYPLVKLSVSDWVIDR
jgi:hypothetical protein